MLALKDLKSVGVEGRGGGRVNAAPFPRAGPSCPGPGGC